MTDDALQSVLNILSTGWNDSNTDSTTPQFIKITDQKRINFNQSQDWVIAQRVRTSTEPQGIGTGQKQQYDRFNLDVRVQGQDKETHFLKVVEEVERILDNNIVNPVSPYDILDPDGDRQDLSDKTRWMWRIIMPITLIQYCKSR